MEKGFGWSGEEEPDGHSSWAPWSYEEIGEISAKLNPVLSEDKIKHTCNWQKNT